jgi:hypothetical protein
MIKLKGASSNLKSYTFTYSWPGTQYDARVNVNHNLNTTNIVDVIAYTNGIYPNTLINSNYFHLGYPWYEDRGLTYYIIDANNIQLSVFNQEDDAPHVSTIVVWAVA